MKNLVSALSVIPILFVMGGCFSGRITLSNTEKYADGEIGSLYVYIEDFDKYRNYAVKFGKELQEQFPAEGIPCKVFIRKELDLTGPKETAKDVAGFGATHFMRITAPSAAVFDGGQRTILTFGIQVDNAQNGESLWSGVLQMRTGLIKTKNESGDAVKIMISKMKEDGVIKT